MICYESVIRHLCRHCFWTPPRTGLLYIWETICLFMNTRQIQREERREEIEESLSTYELTLSRRVTHYDWRFDHCSTCRYACSSEETFLQDLIVILKHSLHNYYKILKCFLVMVDYGSWTNEISISKGLINVRPTSVLFVRSKWHGQIRHSVNNYLYLTVCRSFSCVVCWILSWFKSCYYVWNIRFRISTKYERIMFCISQIFKNMYNNAG